MWKVVFETPTIEREVTKQMQSGEISIEDRRVIAAWIKKVELNGPEAIRKDKVWDDHELYDDWKGYRSSCFSNSGRIIYRVEEDVIKVKIARITPDHDYRKVRKKK